MKAVYLDNAATTALRPEVIKRMTEVLSENYGNASSTHSFGRSSKAILEQCRKNIAAHFNVSPGEIVFTSGGTEADNLALRSAARDLRCYMTLLPPKLSIMRFCTQRNNYMMSMAQICIL
jgi:cysteine desulfurase